MAASTEPAMLHDSWMPPTVSKKNKVPSEHASLDMCRECPYYYYYYYYHLAVCDSRYPPEVLQY